MKGEMRCLLAGDHRHPNVFIRKGVEGKFLFFFWLEIQSLQ